MSVGVDVEVGGLRAEPDFRGLNAVCESDAAARELHRLGERAVRSLRPGTAAGLGALSTREREVATMVASGRTNKDIAAALFLSEKTIERYLARIYNKLDIHSHAARLLTRACSGSAESAQDTE